MARVSRVSVSFSRARVTLHFILLRYSVALCNNDNEYSECISGISNGGAINLAPRSCRHKYSREKAIRPFRLDRRMRIGFLVLRVTSQKDRRPSDSILRGGIT